MWYGILGIVAFVLGLLYLFSPEAVRKIDKLGRSIVLTVDTTLKHRKATGLFYLVAGIVLICVGFFLR